MENNKIIAISGQPVTGKGTNVKQIIEILKQQGYSDDRIHVISTGHEFRKYFNAIFEFIKNYQNEEAVEKLSQDSYLRVFSEKREYRDVLMATIIELKKSHADINNLSIEQANNLKEFSALRKIVDTIIDTGIKEQGEKINSELRPEEIWIIDSRLAFYNIPSSFSVRLIATPQVAAERLFYDKSRGKEDSKYESIEDALQAREKRRIGEQARYLRRYGVDLEDENNYDLIIDTSYSTIQDISSTILKCLNNYVQGKPFSKKWTSPKTLLPLQSEGLIGGQGDAEENDKPIKVTEVDGCRYIIEGADKNFELVQKGITLVPYENIDIVSGETPGGRLKEPTEEFLRQHEALFGNGFSYSEIYPEIYEELSKREEEIR